MEEGHAKWVLLCIIGGILMFLGSLVGGITLFVILGDFATEQLGSEIGPIVGTILSILGYIAAAGGISVIVGAIIVAMDHYRLGKFVIMLGAGLGLIGLIIMLITGIMAGTAVDQVTGIVSTIINGSYGFLGVLLTIFSRRKLKKDK
ncbi:MAG: hypothetical protein ACTSR8_16040 [Promethearchaeota archaeon]